MAQSNQWWGAGKCELTTMAHHRISPPEASQHRDSPTARPGQWTGTPGTLTGAHAHCHTPEEPQASQGEHYLHVLAAPTPPNTHKAPHAPPHLRDATGQQRPGDNTHMRRGRVGHPRQGKGAQGGHTRGRGWQQWGGGRQAHTAGVTEAIQGPKTPRTRPGHQENQHGVPHTRAVP